MEFAHCPKEDPMALNKDLLAVLACPVCKGTVEPVDKDTGLKCAKCDVVYPVKDDIPIMLADQSVPQKDWQKQAS